MKLYRLTSNQKNLKLYRRKYHSHNLDKPQKRILVLQKKLLHTYLPENLNFGKPHTQSRRISTRKKVMFTLKSKIKIRSGLRIKAIISSNEQITRELFRLTQRLWSLIESS